MASNGVVFQLLALVRLRHVLGLTMLANVHRDNGQLSVTLSQWVLSQTGSESESALPVRMPGQTCVTVSESVLNFMLQACNY